MDAGAAGPLDGEGLVDPAVHDGGDLDGSDGALDAHSSLPPDVGSPEPGDAELDGQAQSNLPDAAHDAAPADAALHDAAADGGSADSAQDASTCSRGPVDIVWAVDGSASMLGEVNQIGAQLSRLLTQLTAAGVDVRMTVLSPFDPVALAGGEPNPRYRFVAADIQNQNTLTTLLSAFSGYADWLRPGVHTDVAVASDSDSSLGSESFRSQLEALLGHGFTFHALAEPSSIFAGCATAEQPGVHYEQLAAMTGGLFLSICTLDWATTFDAFGTGILLDAPIVCQ